MPYLPVAGIPEVGVQLALIEQLAARRAAVVGLAAAVNGYDLAEEIRGRTEAGQGCPRDDGSYPSHRGDQDPICTAPRLEVPDRDSALIASPAGALRFVRALKLAKLEGPRRKPLGRRRSGRHIHLLNSLPVLVYLIPILAVRAPDPIFGLIRNARNEKEGEPGSHPLMRPLCNPMTMEALKCPKKAQHLGRYQSPSEYHQLRHQRWEQWPRLLHH